MESKGRVEAKANHHAFAPFSQYALTLLVVSLHTQPRLRDETTHSTHIHITCTGRPRRGGGSAANPLIEQPTRNQHNTPCEGRPHNEDQPEPAKAHLHPARSQRTATANPRTSSTSSTPKRPSPVVLASATQMTLFTRLFGWLAGPWRPYYTLFKICWWMPRTKPHAVSELPLFNEPPTRSRYTTSATPVT